MTVSSGARGVITRRGALSFPLAAGAGADHAAAGPLEFSCGSRKPGQCANSAIGSCVHAVMASWATICLAERAQVGGQVGGGGQGVGVVVAQDAAAAGQGVVVQVT